MSEALQQRRRTDSAKDRLAGLAVSAGLALVLAAAIESALLVIGMAWGEPHWHRGWVELRLKKSLDWLEGVPWIGALTSQIVDPKQGWLPGAGAWRDMMTLGLLLLAPCYWAGARIGPTLIARYDDEAMRQAPPALLGLRWAGPLGAAQQATWSAVAAWCMSGLGTGRTPFWRPWVLPDVTERLSVAVLAGENGGGKSHLAEAFARTLDRDDELAAIAAQSRAKAWALKLKVKWHELWWWRARHPQQPWDCGYLVEDPAALSRLAQFRPRRPTLLIADELLDKTLHDALQWLSAARVDFRHPVRLLVIDVALPGALALRFDAAQQQWHARAHELGRVDVISLIEARFQSAQFRALVGAQPPLAGHPPTHLLGRDAEWATVTTALGEQPILVAEAVRWVREGGRRYEELQAAAELPHLADAMTAQQARRSPRTLEPDVLGKRRELLRERVLQDRARHRQDALLHALGADAASVGYHALMVATAAGGGSTSLLQRLLASKATPLTPRQLTAAFGQPLPADWVPPIKPAVIADELLRLHAHVHTDSPMSQPLRESVSDLMRQAWLLNPGGARQTVARWQPRRATDPFADAMCTLPTLADLQGSLDARTSVELARSFIELAVFHQGDLETARQALATLLPAERWAARETLLAVLLHPNAGGVPALVLWLDLQRLGLMQAGALTPAQTEALVLNLATESLHLLRQCAVVGVPVDAALEATLDEAAFAALPWVARLGDVVSTSPAIGEAALALDRCVIGLGLRASLGQANRLRQRLRVGLVAALARTRNTEAARRGWAPWVLCSLEQLDSAAWAPTLDELALALPAGTAAVGEPDGPPVVAIARAIAYWGRAHQDSAGAAALAVQRLTGYAQDHPADAAVQEAAAQVWRVLARAHAQTDAQATTQAALPLAEIAARFQQHEGIQCESAQAWRLVSWAYKDSDPQATLQAAQHAADIATRFQQHEGIQYESAHAWRLVSWAHKNSDPPATAQTAQRVADLAARFQQLESLQHEAAQAWRNLAWAHKDTDAQATADAAQHVANIGARFPRHEGIQHEAAQAWRVLSWAHRNTDIPAAAQAAQQVADIAARFPQHDGIQDEAAQAWGNLTWANRNTDAEATAQAAQQVADIAAHFQQHESIQEEAAQAWSILSWAYRNTDAQVTAHVAQKVAHIAAGFQQHEGIQLQAAQAWRNLAWAHKDSDAQAAARAAQQVAHIAARFPQHEGIQHEAAQAWRTLSWVHRSTDTQAMAHAVQQVADIAARFQQHESIQHQAAQAWCFLSSAHRNAGCQATAQAAQQVAAIAARFRQHEGIQHEAAQAWKNATLVAVKFDDEALMQVATRALDELVGAGPEGYRPPLVVGQAIGQIAQQRHLAQVAVDAWRAHRKPRA